MIKDRLENAKTFYSLSDRIKKGLEWLKNNDLNSLDCGRYYIEEDNIYANVDEYETKTDAKYEAHRKYIDIQYMVEGEEYVGVTDLNNCTTCIEYDEEKDLEFFNAKDDFQTLKTGEFFIFYPQDAHKPCINKDKIKCKKVVVKVRIN